MYLFARKPGITIIEVVIAMAITSVAIYGAIFTATKSVNKLKDLNNYQVAALLLEEIANRVQLDHYDANRAAVSGYARYSYQYQGWGNANILTNIANMRLTAGSASQAQNERALCYDFALNNQVPNQNQTDLCYDRWYPDDTTQHYVKNMASINLYEWMKKVQNELPLGAGYVCLANKGTINNQPTPSYNPGGDTDCSYNANNPTEQNTPNFLAKIQWTNSSNSPVVQYVRIAIPQAPLPRTFGINNPEPNHTQVTSAVQVQFGRCDNNGAAVTPTNSSAPSATNAPPYSGISTTTSNIPAIAGSSACGGSDVNNDRSLYLDTINYAVRVYLTGDQRANAQNAFYKTDGSQFTTSDYYQSMAPEVNFDSAWINYWCIYNNTNGAFNNITTTSQNKTNWLVQYQPYCCPNPGAICTPNGTCASGMGYCCIAGSSSSYSPGNNTGLGNCTPNSPTSMCVNNTGGSPSQQAIQQGTRYLPNFNTQWLPLSTAYVPLFVAINHCLSWQNCSYTQGMYGIPQASSSAAGRIWYFWPYYYVHNQYGYSNSTLGIQSSNYYSPNGWQTDMAPGSGPVGYCGGNMYTQIAHQAQINPNYGSQGTTIELISGCPLLNYLMQ